MSEIVPDFAPSDRSDGGRKPGDWRSIYTDPGAKRGIYLEAVYLGVLLFGIPIAIILLWLGEPRHWFGLTNREYNPILKYGIAWFSGVFGGTLFALKWLYHSVARQIWHQDRQLWRIFTPHISGGLSFAFVALISSGMLDIFNHNAVESHATVVGIAFLVGYFSDSAIAKLTEIADTIFGISRAREKHKEKKSTL